MTSFLDDEAVRPDDTMMRPRAYLRVAVFSLVGAAVAFLIHVSRPDRFESVALVMIKAGEVDDDARVGRTPLDTDFAETFFQSRMLAETARRLAVRNAAPDHSTPSDEDQITTWLTGLHVSRSVSDRRALQISYVAASPETARAAVASLLTAATEVLDPEHERHKALMNELTSARDESLVEFRRKESFLREFREAAPPQWPGREAYGRLETELAAWEQRRRALKNTGLRPSAPSPESTSKRKIVEDEHPPVSPRQTSSGDDGISQAGQGPVLIELLAEEASLLERYGINHPKVKAIRARINAFQIEAGVETPLSRLQAEEKVLLETLGPRHPKVLSVRSRIAALAEGEDDPAPSPPASLIPTATGPVLTVPPLAGANPSATRRAVESPSVEVPDSDSTAARKELEELTSRIARRRAEFEDLSEWNALETNLSREADEARRQLNMAEARVVDADQVSSKRDGSLIVLSEPGNGTLVERGLWIPLLVGGIGGALVGLVPSRRSVRRRKALPLAARPEAPPVLHLPPPRCEPGAGRDESDIPDWLVVHHRPKSYEAGIYRSLRTALRFAAGASDRCFAVLCSSHADEARIVALNVAASFALANRKTLLIDGLPDDGLVTGSLACDAPSAAADSSPRENIFGSPAADTRIARLVIAQAANCESASRRDLERWSDEIRHDYDVAIFCTDSISGIRALAETGLHGGTVVISPSSESDEVLGDRLAEYSMAVGRSVVTIVKYDLSPA